MARNRQTFTNRGDAPFDVEIEPWAHVCTLKKDDTLEIVFDAQSELSLEVLINGPQSISLFPNFDMGTLIVDRKTIVKILVNGKEAFEKSIGIGNLNE